jgi:hypothetical protein
MHQQPFAVRQARAAMQREVRRVIHHRHGGRFGEIHSRDHVKRAAGRRQRVFGECAVVGHGGHRIARKYVLHFGAHRVHNAGDFGAGSERKRRPDLVFALNLQNVEKVKRRRAVADAHLGSDRAREREYRRASSAPARRTRELARISCERNGSTRLRQWLLGPAPRHDVPEDGMPPATAYHLIHDELIMDGSSRFNLATFCGTWMEPEAAS